MKTELILQKKKEFTRHACEIEDGKFKIHDYDPKTKETRTIPLRDCSKIIRYFPEGNWELYVKDGFKEKSYVFSSNSYEDSKRAIDEIESYCLTKNRKTSLVEQINSDEMKSLQIRQKSVPYCFELVVTKVDNAVLKDMFPINSQCKLKIEEKSLKLESDNKAIEPTYIDYRHLRNYGIDSADSYKIVMGRRCKFGEGTIILKLIEVNQCESNCQALHVLIMEKIKAMTQRESIQGLLQQQSETLTRTNIDETQNSKHSDVTKESVPETPPRHKKDQEKLVPKYKKYEDLNEMFDDKNQDFYENEPTPNARDWNAMNQNNQSTINNVNIEPNKPDKVGTVPVTRRTGLRKTSIEINQTPPSSEQTKVAQNNQFRDVETYGLSNKQLKPEKKISFDAYANVEDSPTTPVTPVTPVGKLDLQKFNFIGSKPLSLPASQSKAPTPLVLSKQPDIYSNKQVEINKPKNPYNNHINVSHYDTLQNTLSKIVEAKIVKDIIKRKSTTSHYEVLKATT